MEIKKLPSGLLIASWPAPVPECGPSPLLGMLNGYPVYKVMRTWSGKTFQEMFYHSFSEN